MDRQREREREGGRKRCQIDGMERYPRFSGQPDDQSSESTTDDKAASETD